ncbi:MAG: flagellar basal body rod protein FlgC [Spirochaetaceae bacterium]|jgi:flagellar basal-body rod protein FlgC|nr:flagellar basal body rod protein FlgC [Spirochaetaceae bacterium]
MGMFSAINTAQSGLSAERLRLDVISDNIANANTTRTEQGGAFRRSRVVFRPRTEQPYWRSPFLPQSLQQKVGTGVRVSEIEKDMDADLRLVYDPTHPDAIQVGPNKGYVEYPNVVMVNEMVDMIAASRAYEANVNIMNGSKSMFQKALDIVR